MDMIWIIVLALCGIIALVILGAYMHHKMAETIKRFESGFIGFILGMAVILVIAVIIWTTNNI